MIGPEGFVSLVKPPVTPFVIRGARLARSYSVRKADVISSTHPTGDPLDAPRSLARGPRLLAVGGGKGGVGKTFVTANLAAALARAGKRRTRR